MKKILFISLIIVCLLLTGCGKNDEIGGNEVLDGSWEKASSGTNINMNEEEIKIFNNAKDNYQDMNIEAIAILGRQVVAGTNYMFLARAYQDNTNYTYKIVIVYHDLEGKNTITKVSNFDFNKYINEYIDDSSEELVGGWYVESGTKKIALEDKVQKAFDQATSTLTGMSFSPIVVIGKQIVAGANYAIICYGQASYENTKEGIYLLTLYEDLNGNSSISGSAYIDLADYNK